MGKLTLATKLADELGSSVDETMRFVDEVGVDAARKTVDDLAAKGSKTVSKWWKPTAVTGGLVGGGALTWRQQSLEQAEAIAAKEQSYADAVAEIMGSDLNPEAKRELIEQLNNSSSRNGDGGGDGDDGNLLPDDIQTTVVLLIVLVFVLKFALNGGSD